MRVVVAGDAWNSQDARYASLRASVAFNISGKSMTIIGSALKALTVDTATNGSLYAFAVNVQDQIERGDRYDAEDREAELLIVAELRPNQHGRGSVLHRQETAIRSTRSPATP